MKQEPKNKKLSLIFTIILCVALQACASTPAQSEGKDDVVVSEISREGPVKRQELESAIMRFADRYMAFMGMEAVRIEQQAKTPEHRSFATGLNLAARSAAVDIAVGPNAVENLLDMIVLVTLTRQELETYWVPEVLGSDLGGSLIRTSKVLEEEIWKKSKSVLTEEQQQALREMITKWNEDHPDQHFFWEIRFGEFSGQRAAELARVKQTGGLLGEVQQTRESVQAIQAFGERVMYYMLRAPNLTRLEAELGMRRMFASPEVKQLLDNSERLTQSTERYASLLEYLPQEREAAINQLFEELNKERQSAINQMFLQTSIEREAAINQVMEEQRETIKHLLASEEFKGAIEKIGHQGDAIVNTTFIRGVLLILIWVVAYVLAKLVYDRLLYKQTHSRQ